MDSKLPDIEIRLALTERQVKDVQATLHYILGGYACGEDVSLDAGTCSDSKQSSVKQEPDIVLGKS